MNAARSMTRQERIVAYSLAISALRQEQRIEEWIAANPTAVVWTLPMTDGRRLCTVVRENKVVAKSAGVDDTDARAQAFSVVFLDGEKKQPKR